MADWPVVLLNDDGIRPAGSADRCFYCSRSVGEEHGRDCVIVQKRVRLRYIFEVDVEVPYFWTPEDTLFHRNESSWCADNAVETINDISEKMDAESTPINERASIGPCWCDRFHAEFVSVVDATPTRKESTPEEMEEGERIRAARSGKRMARN